MAYVRDCLKRKITEAAERAITAAGVNIHPDTVEPRTTQLKAIADTFNPHSWLVLLMGKGSCSA